MVKQKIKIFWSWLCRWWTPTSDPHENLENEAADGVGTMEEGEDATHEDLKNSVREGTSEEVKPATSKGKKLVPGKRNGSKWSKGPKERGGKGDELASQAPKNPNLKARMNLICRKAHRGGWELIIPKNKNIMSVKQGDDGLSIRDGEYVVSTFTEAVDIVFQDGREVVIPLGNEEVVAGGSGHGRTIIFKFPSDWRGDGRRVPRITSGHYIVIAPREFTRTGHAPIDQGYCIDNAKFVAHYFHVADKETGDGNIDNIGFEEEKLEVSASRINIKGASVFDDSKMGRLFVGNVPNWGPTQDVVWMHVGEERSGGWEGMVVSPRETLTSALKERQGRFFIRAYDGNDKLLDSEDFRYMRDLRTIHVNGEPYTESTVLPPKPNGHPDTKISFFGENDASIDVELRPGSAYAKAQKSNVIVSPHPDGDKVECTLISGGGRVDVVLNLPRIWWRLEHDNDPDQMWRDTPIILSREECLGYADAGASISLRLPKKTRTARLRLDDELGKTYPRKDAAKGAIIPLREIRDYEQISDRSDDPATLRAEIVTINSPIPILVVNASPFPKIGELSCEPTEIIVGETTTLSWSTRYADPESVFIEPDVGLVEVEGTRELQPKKTTTYVLEIRPRSRDGANAKTTVRVLPIPKTWIKANPLVKTVRGWGGGKGFSLREVEDAGLTPYDASLRGLRVDQRRRSLHLENVIKLKESCNV